MQGVRSVAVACVLIAGLTACGGEAASDAAVPGAPAGGDTRPPISTIAASTTAAPATTVAPATTAPATAATTVAPSVSSTTVAQLPTTTLATEPSTTLAPETTVPPTTEPAPTTTELVYEPEAAEGTLRFGMEGPRSKQLQADLVILGHLPAGADDGLYGPGTAGGVRRFQEAEGLVVDGVAGPVTLGAIVIALEELTAADA